MANCMIGFPNRIDSSTLSGGSWAGTLPLVNLQSRVLGKVARSSDATLASTKFDINIGSAKNIRLLALVNHTCSLAALYRVRGASDAGFTSVVYDTGWTLVWPVLYPWGSLEWEDDNFWTGQYTDEQRTGYTATCPVILSSNTVAQYWRVEINDTSNAAGYVQIGRVFIGAVYQPTNNMDVGSGLGWETKTVVQEAIGGAEYFQRRTPYRVATVKLGLISVDESFGNDFEIQRRAGLDSEIFWIHDPADTVHALRRQFIGRMQSLSPILFPYATNNSTSFQIKELL